MKPLASVPYNLLAKRKREQALSKNRWLFRNIMASAEQTRLRRNKPWITSPSDYQQLLITHNVTSDDY